MVKHEIENSLLDDDESNIINENGKRPNDSGNKDGKKRIKTKSLYRQPTANELNRLQETENLFNSNLFRLQIEEVLQEVKVKEKTVKRFQEWFAEFKTYLLTLPEDDTEYDLTEKSFVKQLSVKLPISKRHDRTKVMFKFHKFNDIEIIGSYSMGCSISSKLIVDLQITVPAETYTKNDSINYKYHKKRAAYLAYIASHLSKSEIVEEIKYIFSNGCETKPIIEIKPKGKLSNHLSVRLNLACDAEAYKLHRFSPSRNNLRESWLFSSENQENVSEIGPPTPYYNSSILCDITASVNQEFLRETLINSENLKQAVTLLKIWIRQRNLQVSGYIISMLIAYLVQSKRINNIMSSYQIIRNVWIALKSSEWDTKGISLSKEQNTSIEEFHEHFPVVFIDRTGYYNICWQMCKGTYYALRRESTLAVDILDNGKINSFIPLFMTPVTPLLQFDRILCFKNLPEVKEAVLNKAPKSARVNYGLDDLSLVTDILYNLMSKGLSNRVDLIQQIVEADFSWSVKKKLDKAKKEGYKEKLMFGFILNPENAMNIVDKGPPANMPEAEEFRAFWGDKSELRRFQDGSITEACVWSAHCWADRREICRQLLDHLLRDKYDIQPAQLQHCGGQLSALLVRRSAVGAQLEESSLRVLQAFDELRAELRALRRLPLDVSAVYGISPVFSYCEPFPPLPALAERNPRRRGDTSLIKDTTQRLPEYIPVNEAILELSHSGKWPGDLQAFRCLKAAFHLQIADRLKKQFSLPTQACASHVDVLRSGLVFRLRVAHPKELTLLRREAEGGVVRLRDGRESVALQRDTVLLPALRGALHGLHQRHPCFGPATCLLSRWLSSHLLAPHFPPTLVQLLVAAVFLRAAPLVASLVAPLSAAGGLLRALRLLADTDWTREMLLLDFNDDLTKDDVAAIERQFQSRDEQAPYMYVVTSYDGALPSAWSRAGPSPRAALRAQSLARAALRYAGTALLADMKDDILETFIPSLKGYDILIHLNPQLVPYSGERLSSKPRKRPEGSVTDIIPVVEFNPVQLYLDELMSIYEDFAVFFYDVYGGDVIAVLWKPDIHEPRDLQILKANGLKPVTIDGQTKYKVNIEAIIEDFKIIGEGLVTNVTVNNE
ncbi:unnamed protein product [Euphydryas editha]|uniref:Nucleolar protein 6 n=1 Tax=Euphydryas editha TaxID=104508 RepID=A0AAU9TMT8_EUPED|nr:unnamed protein product [Euphydryas editha]